MQRSSSDLDETPSPISPTHTLHGGEGGGEVFTHTQSLSLLGRMIVLAGVGAKKRDLEELYQWRPVTTGTHSGTTGRWCVRERETHISLACLFLNSIKIFYFLKGEICQKGEIISTEISFCEEYCQTEEHFLDSCLTDVRQNDL